MKKQMMKVVLMLTVTSMSLAGCGEKTDTVDMSTEKEVSVVENEISSQEETQSNEDIGVVINEEENIESEEQGLEENKTEEVEESEDPQKPQEPETPEEPKKPTHEHKYTSVVTKEPTCAGLHGHGERLYTCSCGDSYTEVIYCYPCEGDGVMVVIQEPDCQHCGIKVDHCKWCGGQMIGQEIPMTEHVPFDHYSKVNGHWVLWCRDCGYVVDVIPVEESPEEPQRTTNMENSLMKIFLYNKQ